MDSIVKDWLSNRKITPSVQSEFNVHAGMTPMFGECIVIPIHDENGKYLFNKYRRSPLSDVGPKYMYDKGGATQLYAIDKAKDEPEIVITEGELDALVCWSANIPAVSSTGGCMAFNVDWARFFLNKSVIICYDNDAPGGEGMARTLSVIPYARCLFLPEAAAVKDISDYVSRGGDLHELLKTAKRFDNYEDVVADRAERLATWKSTHFHDAYIKMKAERPKSERKERTSGDDVERARQFPIVDIIDFNRLGNAKCLWHAEKESSLHYYADDNHCYCFGGCGRAYDAIDVYRKVNNCSFKEAVRKLQ